MKKIGFVKTDDGTTYRLFSDMSWSVSHQGDPLPGAARRLAAVYDGFQDFPAYPGQRRLQDLAKHTGGRVVWLLPAGDPSVVH